MGFISTVRNYLYHNKIRELDVDDNKLLIEHKKIIEQKALLRSAFIEFYNEMFLYADSYFNVKGREVELGSGSSFIKEIRPCVETSDIRVAENIDLVVDATKMPFDNSSIRCIYAINVFHHIKLPDDFFGELIRVLKPGGGCILIEPHIGFFSALLHKILHKDEYFDPEEIGWMHNNIRGPMSGANQALAHIVFERDLTIFEEKYGANLKIVNKTYCLNSARYLFSGGLNFHQLLPDYTEKILKDMERMLSPLAEHWSLHQIIVIKKNEV